MTEQMNTVSVKSMKLNLISFKEDEGYIVYCPALELCGCGKSKPKAQESFQIVLEEYIRYTTENQTLIADLEKHGWKITKKGEKLTQPKISELFKRNNYLETIFNKHNFNKYSVPVKMQLA